MIGKRKSGELVPLELTFSNLIVGDQPVCVTFARDISKRKLAQRYLMAHYAATCILAEARTCLYPRSHGGADGRRSHNARR